jgi:predicted O-methyltransferase YrrM
MDESEIRKILSGAVEAAKAEALRIWKRDNEIDCGSCGGAMLSFDARSKVAKIASEMGLTGGGSECWLYLKKPDGVRSQNADIPQGMYRVFREHLEKAGLGKAVKKFWNYID